MRLALALAFLACRAPAVTRPPAIDWSVPPPPRAAARFVPPAIEPFTLRSGVRVLVVENDRLPLVTVLAIASGAGSRGAPAGLAALTATLLADGAGPRDRGTFAVELERQGAVLDVDIASDHATLALSALSEHLPGSLALLADALRRPRFADEDVARVRADRVAELELHRDQPRIVAAQRFDRLVFGDHPYGQPAEGVAGAVAGYRAAEVRAHWARAYGPTTTTLIVAGAVERRALEPMLDAAFGDWTNSPPPASAPASAEAVHQLAYIDRPGAPDVAIVIGRRVPAEPDRTHRLAADLESAVIGGVESRLQRRLDALGASAAIAGSFWRGELGATWSVATTVKAPLAAAVIRTILATLDETRAADVPDAELAHARGLLLRAFPAAFETNSGVAHAVQRLVVQRLPLDHYARYADSLSAITPAQARAAMAPLLAELTVVVVGDWQRLAPELTALGIPLARDVR